MKAQACTDEFIFAWPVSIELVPWCDGYSTLVLGSWLVIAMAARRNEEVQFVFPR